MPRKHKYTKVGTNGAEDYTKNIDLARLSSSSEDEKAIAADTSLDTTQPNINNVNPLVITNEAFVEIYGLKTPHFLAKYLMEVGALPRCSPPTLSNKETTGLKELIHLGKKCDSLLNLEGRIEMDIYSGGFKKSLCGSYGYLSGFAYLSTIGSMMYTIISTSDREYNIRKDIKNLVNVLADNCSEYLFYPKCDNTNVCQKAYSPFACATSYGINKTAEYTFSISLLCNETCANLIEDNKQQENSNQTLFLTLFLILTSGVLLFYIDKGLKRFCWDYKQPKTAKEFLGKSVNELDTLLNELTSQNEALTINSDIFKVQWAIQRKRRELIETFQDKLVDLKTLARHGLFSTLALNIIKSKEQREQKNDNTNLTTTEEDSKENALIVANQSIASPSASGG